MALLTDFGPRIMPECTFGALLRPLFGQSQKGDSPKFAIYGAAPKLPGCTERERSQGNGSPWPSVLSRWLAWVLLYLFIEVVMNSLMEGAFTSVYILGGTPHSFGPKDVIPY
jgi:hypothetical protein